eukprot:173614-Chlamydomonas_euryale.AAC.1
MHAPPQRPRNQLKARECERGRRCGSQQVGGAAAVEAAHAVLAPHRAARLDDAVERAAAGRGVHVGAHHLVRVPAKGVGAGRCGVHVGAHHLVR